MSPIAVAAIVLAAGRGARLGGANKAALALPDGRTFLQAVVDTARAAGCARVIVVAGGPHAAQTRLLAERAGVEVAENPRPERGMLSSLIAGLAALDPGAVEAALSWPVDHPRPSRESVEAIVAAARRDRVVVPRVGGRGGHPTAFGADLWPELVAAVGSPLGARAILQTRPERILALPLADAGILRDADLPEDLE